MLWKAIILEELTSFLNSLQGISGFAINPSLNLFLYQFTPPEETNPTALDISFLDNSKRTSEFSQSTN